jgi:cytochrome c6
LLDPQIENVNGYRIEWSLNMKRTSAQVLTTATAIAVMSFLPFSVQAQDASATYKARCAMCHGADGRKIAAHDLQAAAVQGMSDSDLSAIITNGKGKMPASKSLKPEEVKQLAAYVRTLKK